MSQSKKNEIEGLTFLRLKNVWFFFRGEHPAFWCLCGYLFFEYFRPQSIYPIIDFLPWSQLLLILSLFLGVFFDKKSKLSFTIQHLFLLLFFSQIHISIAFALYPDWSKKYYMDSVQWMIIFFLITIIVTNRARFYVLLLVFFACNLKLSVGVAWVWLNRGLSFTSWGLMGPPGYFQNSGELAIEMLIMFTLCYGFIRAFYNTSNKTEKIVMLVGLITSLMVILGASSRGSQIALVLICVILNGRQLLRFKVLLSLIFVFLIGWALIPDEQKLRFQGIGEDRTSEQRLLYWSNGVEMIRDFPLIGVGYYNFIPYYTDMYPDDILFTNNLGLKVAELPHNILVQVGTDAGLPGLFFFVLFFISLLFAKNDNSSLGKVVYGLKVGVVAFFLAGQFVTVAYYPFIWISAAFITSYKKIIS